MCMLYMLYTCASCFIFFNIHIFCVAFPLEPFLKNTVKPLNVGHSRSLKFCQLFREDLVVYNDVFIFL